MGAPPSAFILSLIGLFKDEGKGYAVAGMILSLLTGAMFLIPVFCGL